MVVSTSPMANGKRAKSSYHIFTFVVDDRDAERLAYTRDPTFSAGATAWQYLPTSWKYKDFSDAAGPEQELSRGLHPLPIITLSEVVPDVSHEIGDILYPDVNSSQMTIYEENPFEFGCWRGGRAQGFIPTKFLGTRMIGGEPAQANHCVNGFDKMTFAQGSTGGAWNFWFIDAFYNIPLFWKRDEFGMHSKRQNSASNTSAAQTIPVPPSQESNMLVQLVNLTAGIFNQTFNDSMFGWYPNPFMDYSELMANVSELLIVDGSEGGETIPMRPLIIPERDVDFIIAFDASGEYPGNNCVNGTTFGRSAYGAQKLGMPFPKLPDADTFVGLEMNKYPTFFGCNASARTPLVLYIPNAPWSSYNNYSFMLSEFTNHQLDLVFENSLNMATLGRGSPDNSSNLVPFPACIACAMIHKALLRIQQTIPAACTACFERHCWNGTTVNTSQALDYNPALILDPQLNYEEWNSSVWSAPGE